MSPLIKLGGFAIVAAILVGCGGDGSNPNIANNYTGAWTGTYTSPETNGTGTFDITVTEDGSMSGTVTGTGGLNGTFVGTVLGTGQFAATHVYSTDGTFTMISGALALTPAGLNGNFQYEWVKQHYVGTFTDTLSGSGSTTSGSSSGATATTAGTTSGSTSTATTSTASASVASALIRR